MYNEIYHFGVKGMKWGIRKKNYDSPSIFKKKSKQQDDDDDDSNAHEDYAKAHTKKSIKDMSDAELRAINNRLNMEQQYARLTESKSKGRIESGMEHLNKIVSAGTTIATLISIPVTIYNNSDKLVGLASKLIK